MHLYYIHIQPCLVAQIMGTLSVTVPGCPDMDISKNGVEVKRAFTKQTQPRIFCVKT